MENRQGRGGDLTLEEYNEKNKYFLCLGYMNNTYKHRKEITKELFEMLKDQLIEEKAEELKNEY
jgi:hypothetical protein